VVDRTKRFLPKRSALFGDLHKALRKIFPVVLTQTFQTLAYGFCHRLRHALAGKFGQFLRESMCLFILDIKAHAPFYPGCLPFYHNASDPLLLG